MMNFFFTVAFSLAFFSTSLSAQSLKDRLHEIAKENHQVLSYSAAKKMIFNEIYLQRDQKGPFILDVYCVVRHDLLESDVTNGRLPDATVLNTEHSWPQSKFSEHFAASIQKADLHHLFPTGSQINAERGNFPFAEVTGNEKLSCTESRRGSSRGGERGNFFEPPDQHKGNVARAMFYFSIRYKMAIDETQEYFLRLWHQEDPVDEAERRNHEKIVKIQKNRNPFIDRPEFVAEVEDF